MCIMSGGDRKQHSNTDIAAFKRLRRTFGSSVATLSSLFVQMLSLNCVLPR